jgi:nitronate monooxygenase
VTPAAVTASAASTEETLRRLRGMCRTSLVVSPMAGGPSTVDLVVAVSAAGALGFLAGGYKTAEDLAAEMAAVGAANVGDFGVNLFVPGAPTVETDALAAYVSSLTSEAGALGVALGEPTWDDDDYPRKLDAVLAAPPAMVSFTFGVPAVDVVRALRERDTLVAITVTTPEEATEALAVGPDVLCLQGAEAGAHRGSLRNEDHPDADRPVRALLAAVRRRTLVPLIAAGGVGGCDDVRDLLARGAALVQAGTAFLRCPESGAADVLKAALGDGSFATTAITRAFSGRRARALVNAMVREHASAPRAYPEINNLTRPLRAAAARAEDTDHMSLYAGTAYARAEARPAAEVVRALAGEESG